MFAQPVVSAEFQASASAPLTMYQVVHQPTALPALFVSEELQLGNAVSGIVAEAKRAEKARHGEDLLLLYYYLFEGFYSSTAESGAAVVAVAVAVAAVDYAPPSFVVEIANVS